MCLLLLACLPACLLAFGAFSLWFLTKICRLENDFIVFRGNEQESAGQILKGTVVLCLPSALKVEDIHLQLSGTLRLS